MCRYLNEFTCFIVIITTLLICDNNRLVYGQFVIPEATVEVFTPKGFRVSIPGNFIL